MTWSTMSRMGAAMMGCVLAGCGGGGDERPKPPDHPLFAVDKSSISIASINDGAMVLEPVTVVMTDINFDTPTYYVSVVSDNDPFTVDVKFSGLTANKVTASATPVPRNDLPLGTRSTGHLTYSVCKDAACKDKVWSQVLPYTITHYSIDTSPLLVIGYQGGPQPTATLAITPPDTAHEVGFYTDPFVATVDHTDPGSAVFTALMSTATLGDSSTFAEFGLSGQQGTAGGAIRFPMTLHVAGDIVAPAPPAITITSSTSTTAAFGGQVPVSFALGLNAAWTATSDQAWLVLDSASGIGAGSIAWHLDTSRLGAVNQSASVGTITVTAPDIAPTAIPIAVSMALSDITTVTPAQVPSGRATTVHVTGHGLSHLGGVGAILVDGIPATGGSIASDTEATLTLPPMSAGAARIAIDNALSLATPYATLAVTDAGTFTSALVPHRQAARLIQFDATGNAVFVIDAAANALVRYRLVGGSWQVDTLPIDAIGSMGLSLDAATLYVTSNGNVVEVDTQTLQVRTSHGSHAGTSNTSPDSRILPVTNDMRLWFENLGYLDLRDGKFKALDLSKSSRLGGPLYLSETWPYASADGSSLVAVDTSGSPQRPNLWYDPRTGSVTLQAAVTVETTNAQFDARATEILLRDSVLYRTGTFEQIGKATDPSLPSFTEWLPLLSPDGSRIYRVVTDMDAITDHLEVFDTTALVPGTSNFAILGTIALPAKPLSCTYGQAGCDGRTAWTISPDGCTLFWAGQDGLVVVPVPATLSGISQATRAHAARAPRLLRATPH